MSRLTKLSRRHRFARRAAGLSLIELMISIALGLMILTAVITVFVNTSAARNEVERTSRQIENGRYAVELLSDDLRVAGFYGEMGVTTLPAVGALADPEHDPCSTNAGHWGKAMNFHVLGFDNGAGVPACVPASLKAGTDVVVVRRVKTCAAGVAGCEAVAATKPYLQVSLCDTEMAVNPFVVALGSGGFPLRIRDCATRAAQRQYLVNIYFISTDNGAGQSIPTLKVMKLMEPSGGGMVETALVEGIEEFNVEYGIDTDGDGTVDAYTTDPAAFTGNPAGSCGTCTPESNWRNVLTVQFHILARNLDKSPGYTDDKTYGLGRNAALAPITVGPFSDGYRRHIYTGLVRIANAAGRRDTP
jgi:type IV pilus assembly protein PilW